MDLWRRLYKSPLLKLVENLFNFFNSASFYFLKDFIYLFLEKGKGGIERWRETLMWERNTAQLPLVRAPAGGQTRNPGMCPERGSNLQLFALWNNTQSTETHQSVLTLLLFKGNRASLCWDFSDFSVIWFM